MSDLPTEDELRALKTGEALEFLAEDRFGVEHRIRATGTGRFGLHRGLRRCRVECLTCEYEIREASPWPARDIAEHLHPNICVALPGERSPPLS